MTRPETQTKTGWAAKYRKLKSAAKNKAQKTIITVALLTTAASPALACEGFKTSMNALEQTVLNYQKQQQAENNQSTLPHLNSLNKDLDELERRVAEYQAKKALEAKGTYALKEKWSNQDR